MHSINNIEARRRHIAAADFAPCAEAFIDRRNPNSEGKLNYSFIGPGVAQSDQQTVNLAEPHGFNVGGVTLPAGRINNLHLHFTAEVFIVAGGEWEFLWGNNGENAALLAPFDLFAIPTWIFRGFVNKGGKGGGRGDNDGDDDAFMFAVLGGDDTGGIVWNPKVLADAEKAGLRLTAANRVVDLQKGEAADGAGGENFMPPLPEEEMRQLPKFSPDEMEKYIVRWNNLRWRDDALPAGGALAAALGCGMSAARHHNPPVGGVHGFALEWLKLQPGDDSGAWQTAAAQVFIVFAGTAEIVLNAGAEEIAIPLAKHSIYSVPANVWRRLRAAEETVILAITGGDARPNLQWAEDAMRVAAEKGLAWDADRRLAPARALPPHIAA